MPHASFFFRDHYGLDGLPPVPCALRPPEGSTIAEMRSCFLCNQEHMIGEHLCPAFLFQCLMTAVQIKDSS